MECYEKNLMRRIRKLSYKCEKMNGRQKKISLIINNNATTTENNSKQEMICQAVDKSTYMKLILDNYRTIKFNADMHQLIESYINENIPRICRGNENCSTKYSISKFNNNFEKKTVTKSKHSQLMFMKFIFNKSKIITYNYSNVKEDGRSQRKLHSKTNTFLSNKPLILNTTMPLRCQVNNLLPHIAKRSEKCVKMINLLIKELGGKINNVKVNYYLKNFPCLKLVQGEENSQFSPKFVCATPPCSGCPVNITSSRDNVLICNGKENNYPNELVPQNAYTLTSPHKSLRNIGESIVEGGAPNWTSLDQSYIKKSFNEKIDYGIEDEQSTKEKTSDKRRSKNISKENGSLSKDPLSKSINLKNNENEKTATDKNDEISSLTELIISNTSPFQSDRAKEPKIDHDILRNKDEVLLEWTSSAQSANKVIRERLSKELDRPITFESHQEPLYDITEEPSNNLQIQNNVQKLEKNKKVEEEEDSALPELSSSYNASPNEVKPVKENKRDSEVLRNKDEELLNWTSSAVTAYKLSSHDRCQTFDGRDDLIEKQNSDLLDHQPTAKSEALVSDYSKGKLGINDMKDKSVVEQSRSGISTNALIGSSKVPLLTNDTRDNTIADQTRSAMSTNKASNSETVTDSFLKKQKFDVQYTQSLPEGELVPDEEPQNTQPLIQSENKVSKQYSLQDRASKPQNSVVQSGNKVSENQEDQDLDEYDDNNVLNKNKKSSARVLRQSEYDENYIPNQNKTSNVGGRMQSDNRVSENQEDRDLGEYDDNNQPNQNKKSNFGGRMQSEYAENYMPNQNKTSSVGGRNQSDIRASKNYEDRDIDDEDDNYIPNKGSSTGGRMKSDNRVQGYREDQYLNEFDENNIPNKNKTSSVGGPKPSDNRSSRNPGDRDVDDKDDNYTPNRDTTSNTGGRMKSDNRGSTNREGRDIDEYDDDNHTPNRDNKSSTGGRGKSDNPRDTKRNIQNQHIENELIRNADGTWQDEKAISQSIRDQSARDFQNNFDKILVSPDSQPEISSNYGWIETATLPFNSLEPTADPDNEDILLTNNESRLNYTEHVVRTVDVVPLTSKPPKNVLSETVTNSINNAYDMVEDYEDKIVNISGTVSNGKQTLGINKSHALQKSNLTRPQKKVEFSRQRPYNDIVSLKELISYGFKTFQKLKYMVRDILSIESEFYDAMPCSKMTDDDVSEVTGEMIAEANLNNFHYRTNDHDLEPSNGTMHSNNNWCLGCKDIKECGISRSKFLLMYKTYVKDRKKDLIIFSRDPFKFHKFKIMNIKQHSKFQCVNKYGRYYNFLKEKSKHTKSSTCICENEIQSKAKCRYHRNMVVLFRYSNVVFSKSSKPHTIDHKSSGKYSKGRRSKNR